MPLGAGLSKFASCQNIVLVAHCNDVSKTAHSISLSNLTPIIPVLLDAQILCVVVKVWALFIARLPVLVHAHTHLHTQCAWVRLVGSAKCGLMRSWYFMKPDQCPSRLTSELPFYCYRSNRKRPWLSTFWWKPICNVCVMSLLCRCFFSPGQMHIHNLHMCSTSAYGMVGFRFCGKPFDPLRSALF